MRKWFILNLLVAIPALAGPTMATYKIDQYFQKTWKTHQIQPAPPSTDAEFLRRIYLDLIGRIPTIDETISFLDSKDPNKRVKLIDQLLNSEEMAEYFASRWTNLFLGHERDRFVNRSEFEIWLKNQFQKNAGWDRIAKSILTADGSLQENPPLNWYVKHKLDPTGLADDTARIFLGIQLGCARCHNHPYDVWKTEDFYGLAAFYTGLRRETFNFFERIKLRKLKQERQEAIKNFQKDQRSFMTREAREKREEMQKAFQDLLRLTQDRSTSITAEIKGEKKTYPAKFLLTDKPAIIDRNQREELAEWIVSPDNPYFARAFVNRIWAMLMGKGFVEPVDDFSSLNTPAHQELLDFLTKNYQQQGYDIRYLISSIVHSRVYQLSSATGVAEEPKFLERGKVKWLNADQMFRSMLTATGIGNALRQRDPEAFADRKQLVYRLYVFLFENDESKGKEEEGGSIPQALFLINSKMTNEALRPLPGNITSQLLKRNRPQERVELLYLSTLSRRPTSVEMDLSLQYVKEKKNQQSAYEDLLWVLINSNEFLFQH